MNLRDTVRGIGVRAGVLAVGGLVVGGVLTATALKAAGTMLQVAAGTGLVLTAAGFAMYGARRVRRQLATL